MKKEQLILWCGYALLFVIMLVGILFVWNSRMTITQKLAQEEEAKRPADIELTIISPVDCEKCLHGELLQETIEKQEVHILNAKTVSSDSDEAKNLIRIYNIQRLPAVIVKGEFDKANVQETFLQLGGENVDDALLIQVSQPVFVNVISGTPVGLVDVTYLMDSLCEDCYDPMAHQTILQKNFGIMIQNEQTIDAQSDQGRALIETYHVTELPTVLLSAQAGVYRNLASTWTQVGTIEEDGTFVFRRNTALGSVVYLNLETGEVVRPEPPKE